MIIRRTYLRLSSCYHFAQHGLQKCAGLAAGQIMRLEVIARRDSVFELVKVADWFPVVEDQRVSGGGIPAEPQ